MVNQVNKGNQANIAYTSSKQQTNVKSDLAATQNQPTSLAKTTADSVNLTPQAQQLRGLHDKAEQSSGFDNKKVDELKKAISEGSYKVDIDKLAEKIAGFEFDLYGH